MHHPARNDGRLVGLLQYTLTPREPHRRRVHNKTFPEIRIASFEAEYSSYAIVVQARREA